MNLSLFVILLFSLQGLYWLVGRRAARKMGGQEDYFLAGKSVKLFPLTMTFIATQVGGGLVIGAAEEAYRFGWPVLLYPLGQSVGLILLGCGIGRKLAAFKVTTVAQIFEVVYGSAALKKVASLLSIISLFMILVAQVIASHKFLVSLGMTNNMLFILFWAIVIIYTTQGGLRAVISTDMVQALFFSGVFLVCFGYVLCSNSSISSMQMPQFEDFSGVSSKLCGWLLMPILFMVIEQDMGQRCFAGASPRVVSTAAILAGLSTTVICIAPVFFGSLANFTGLEVPPGGSVLMATIANTTFPWMTALVGCAVLAAVVSTATSLINAISSNLTSDFQMSFLKNKDSLGGVKAVTCVVSMGAIFVAFFMDSIVDVVIQSYELSVSCLFVPTILALYKKRGNFMSAVLAIVCGAVGFVAVRIDTFPLPMEMVSILLSTIGYGIGELLVAYRGKQIEHVAH